MSATLPPFPRYLRASAQDAGTISMQKAGRTKWSVEDWNAAAETLERLVECLYGKGPEGHFAFQMAEREERAAA